MRCRIYLRDVVAVFVFYSLYAVLLSLYHLLHSTSPTHARTCSTLSSTSYFATSTHCSATELRMQWLRVAGPFSDTMVNCSELQCARRCSRSIYPYRSMNPQYNSPMYCLCDSGRVARGIPRTISYLSRDKLALLVSQIQLCIYSLHSDAGLTLYSPEN